MTTTDERPEAAAAPVRQTHVQTWPRLLGELLGPASLAAIVCTFLQLSAQASAAWSLAVTGFAAICVFKSVIDRHVAASWLLLAGISAATIALVLALTTPRSAAADVDLSRYPAYKEEMRYEVTLADQPFARSRLGDRLKQGDYYFFEARLNFVRVMNTDIDTIRVAVLTDPSKLPEWTGIPEVAYREVIGINSSDGQWRNGLLRRLDATTDVGEKAAILFQLFDVEFYLNDVPVSVSDVRLEAKGYSLEYRLPARIGVGARQKYRFVFRSVQPRSETSFPMIVSEPTRRVFARFDYSRASIGPLQTFSAFTGRMPQGTPRMDHDPTNGVLEIKSTHDEQWLLPGSGVFAYWSVQPRLLKVPSSREIGVFVDARYAGADNFLKRPLYPTSDLYLMEPVLRRLLNQVLPSLRQQNLGVKVWDGFRPLGIQREMWAHTPDPRYVADPTLGSNHNRGCAVDLTLTDAAGRERPMPTPFDDFSPRAHRDHPDIPAAARANSLTLTEAMVGGGFVPFPTEWWHFDAPECSAPLVTADPYTP